MMKTILIYEEIKDLQENKIHNVHTLKCQSLEVSKNFLKISEGIPSMHASLREIA